MALAPKQKKPTVKTITVTLNKQILLMVVIGLILLAGGFIGGLCYQKHEDNTKLNIPYPGICNCPMIRLHSSSNGSCC